MNKDKIVLDLCSFFDTSVKVETVDFYNPELGFNIFITYSKYVIKGQQILFPLPRDVKFVSVTAKTSTLSVPMQKEKNYSLDFNKIPYNFIFLVDGFFEFIFHFKYRNEDFEKRLQVDKEKFCAELTELVNKYNARIFPVDEGDSIGVIFDHVNDYKKQKFMLNENGRLIWS